jgi:hypothetical protein
VNGHPDIVWCHDNQHNDLQHNDTRLRGLICESAHQHTASNAIMVIVIMLCRFLFIVLLNVVMLGVVILGVVILGVMGPIV